MDKTASTFLALAVAVCWATPGAEKAQEPRESLEIQPTPPAPQPLHSNPSPPARPEALATASAQPQPAASTVNAKSAAPVPAELPAWLHTAQSDPDADKRQQALSKIRASALHPVPQELSNQLFRSAVVDEESKVRKEAALAIRDLDDQQGRNLLLAGALSPRLHGKLQERAGKAMKWVDHPKLVEALINIVTVELRAGQVTEISPPQTIYITSGGNINAPSGVINLPIELPNIEIQSVTGIIAVPALRALRIISGQNFGADPGQWQGWFERWKQLREVRKDHEQAQSNP